MKVKDLLNTCENDFLNIRISEYIGEPGSCAADPEEDYRVVFDGDMVSQIPDKYLDRTVDLWNMINGNIAILVEG